MESGKAVDGEDELPPSAQPAPGGSGGRVFTPADFAHFAPRSALDMLVEIPGFTLRGEDGDRGLGQASANVLINGARIINKSEGIFTQLGRVATDQVERIEIVDGATLGIPGLSGQVANVITSPTDFSGRFSYFASASPRFASPSLIAGEVSLNGSVGRLDWTAALANGAGRSGSGGGEAFIFDANGNVLETRDVTKEFVVDLPRLSGSLRWTSAGGTVVNANANYNRAYQNFSDDQFRTLTNGVDNFRAFGDRTRGWGYQFGGDIQFGLGPGQLKLIGQERFNRLRSRSDSITTFDDGRADVGSRFASQSKSGETIGRGEYDWSMLDGDWQLSAEAAFNRLNRSAQLFSLDNSGEFVESDFAGGTGGVTEDRYEAILTHSRALTDRLSLQIGGGYEFSTLSQTGTNGLTRSFWRPKGSASLAWQVESGLDISVELARRVGQLSFGDFLASVSLQQGQANAGNVDLVPPQSWEAEVEITKTLGRWGSTELRLYGREIEDFIELVPVEGGLETRGNIDVASIYGVISNSTFLLAALGLNGVQLDLTLDFDWSSLEDPLTGETRAWSGNQDIDIRTNLRHDISGTDWAWGAGLNYNRRQPFIRVGETSHYLQGPVHTFVYLEHKNVFGMRAGLRVFNLTDGRARQDRLVFEGPRNSSALAFRETENLTVPPTVNFSLSGNF